MSILTRRTFTAALASSATISTASGAASGGGQADAAGKGVFVLPPLPYAADALEPAIDTQTMLLHHDKHHAAYVNNVNEAVQAAPEIAGKPAEYLLSHLNEVPESVRTKVRNNLGGHVNHSMFWQIMGQKGGSPEGGVLEAINRDFGGLDKLKEEFNGAGTRLFGSGWVFVLVDSQGKLTLEARPNQDSPLIDGKRALFGNDVWEHAYYLKYQNRRADYLKAWWEIVNWQKIAERYAAARNGTLIV